MLVSCPRQCHAEDHPTEVTSPELEASKAVASIRRQMEVRSGAGEVAAARGRVGLPLPTNPICLCC